MAIKVMIVDDQAISRHFFELTVGASDRYEVVFSVSSAFAADVYLLKEKVDLVLMDILMNDGSNGLDAAAMLKKAAPEIKIVAVTSMPEYSWMERAREIGIESFWYKEMDNVSILEVMDRTMAGESVYPENAPPARLGNACREDFTCRELEVLRELTTGKSNPEIAKTLGISEFTVKAHVRTLLQKTGLSSRTELAIQARVVGIALAPTAANHTD
ncbi:MAG: response regulator transcription factor [Clostridia bacterium]|nr:response regulator transcription factor [Clostridia bacterium]MBR5424098.1 response regulator transcription factor [Clostridia bacterium]